MEPNAQRHGDRGAPGDHLHAVRGTAPIARYAMLWIGGALGAVLLGLWLVHGLDGGSARAPAHRPVDGVLASARAAGCSFARIQGPLEPSRRPPVGGDVRVRAAPDGAYAEPPPRGSLIAALAAGTVVIQYRPALAARQRTLLERLYAHDKGALILTPDATGMRPEVAVTAWRRVLTCPRVSQGTLDAIAQFRDRFRGRGPG
jgi:hypothetical protein